MQTGMIKYTYMYRVFHSLIVEFRLQDDYKDWMPSTVVNGENTIPCNMGQKSVYKRRVANASCYNGENYDFPISVQPCECTTVDYEW